MNLNDLEQTIKKLSILIEGNYENLREFKDKLNQSTKNNTITMPTSITSFSDTSDTVNLNKE